MKNNSDPSLILRSANTAPPPAPAAEASFDAVIDASDALAEVGAMNSRIDSGALPHPTITG